jgi:hypothetical protein
LTASIPFYDAAMGHSADPVGISPRGSITTIDFRIHGLYTFVESVKRRRTIHEEEKKGKY